MTLVRKINNLYQNFASIDAIFEGPSQVLQGVHDVYTVVSKVAEDIYSVVKGVQEVTPNTTSNLTLYIYRSSSLEAARRSVGISKLLYKIAQRDQRDNPFNAETVYKDVDVFRINGTDVETYGLVVAFYRFMLFKDFRHRYRHEYGRTDYVIKVAEIARDLFNLIGTMNTFGVFHRNMQPDKLELTHHFVQRKSTTRAAPAVPTSTSSTSSSSTSTEEPLDEPPERVGLINLELSCALLDNLLWYRLTHGPDRILFVDPRIQRSCVGEERKDGTAVLVYGGAPGGWTEPDAMTTEFLINPDESFEEQRQYIVNKWSLYESRCCAQVILWLLNKIPDPSDDKKPRKLDRLSDDFLEHFDEILDQMKNPRLSRRINCLSAAKKMDSLLITSEDMKTLIEERMLENLYAKKNKKSPRLRKRVPRKSSPLKNTDDIEEE